MTIDLLGGILIGFVLGMGGTLGAIALADRRGLRRRRR